MMHSEFLTMSGKSENYISYREYTVFIEPIYMNCNVTKQEFITRLEDVFKRVVYPVVESKIKKLSINDKLTLIDCNSNAIFQEVEKVDSAARLIAYDLLKLELCGTN